MTDTEAFDECIRKDGWKMRLIFNTGEEGEDPATARWASATIYRGNEKPYEVTLHGTGPIGTNSHREAMQLFLADHPEYATP